MSAVHVPPETRVTAALLRLAGHRAPDRIAARLAELGHRGGHGPEDCPIATHIADVTGLRIVVANQTWRLATDSPAAEPRWWTTPGPVAVFVARHDLGEYPELSTVEVAA